jgi:hypothetical protein
MRTILFFSQQSQKHCDLQNGPISQDAALQNTYSGHGRRRFEQIQSHRRQSQKSSTGRRIGRPGSGQMHSSRPETISGFEGGDKSIRNTEVRPETITTALIIPSLTTHNLRDHIVRAGPKNEKRKERNRKPVMERPERIQGFVRTIPKMTQR